MMKRVSAVAVLCLSVLLCGCATPGYQRAYRTRWAVDDAQAATLRVQQGIDKAVQALEELASPETADLRPPYRSLSAAVTSLDVQIDGLANRDRAIQRMGDAYVKAWEKELGFYRGDAIRQRSAERRGEVMEDLQKVRREFHTTDQSVRPLLVDLKDMRRYLSNDLTVAGVTSALELAVSIAKQATVGAHQLQSLHAELGLVAGELSPVRPQTKEMAVTK
jgi:hypothetical protein